MSNELAVVNQQLEVVSRELLDLKKLVVNQKVSRLEDSLFSKDLAPHYRSIAEQLSKSSLVPKALVGKPTDVFIVMAMGYQIGLSIEQSIQDIGVINGRPGVYGDAMLALCMQNPDFGNIIEEPLMNGNTIVGYKCTVTRKGMGESTQIYTLDMAKKAGLLGKPGPWTTSTSRMLQFRARGFALRDRFPDSLKGIRSAEELHDYIDADFHEIKDSKGSRTETLKKDYLTKTGAAHDSEETINFTDDFYPASASESSEKITIIDVESSEVAKSGERENVSDSATFPSLLSENQLNTIKQLIEEKQVPQERVNTGLEYYGVSRIEEFPTDLADLFIENLRKI